MVPGASSMSRLLGLMGRGHALEYLVGAEEISGDMAELYGVVNRSLPDVELDAFVEALAWRIASFDKQTIADAKRLAMLSRLVDDSDIAPEWKAFVMSLGRPATQARIQLLFERDYNDPAHVETRYGRHAEILDVV